MAAVTLQISLAPSDVRHAKHLLPHQARVWRDQVAEILLTIDMHRSGGRFSESWQQGASLIRPLAESIEGARVIEVDYSPVARDRVAAEFFGGRAVPLKDHRGGPYYSYFFGLSAAQHDFVLHADSDMFFGGGSGTWLREATENLAAHPEVIIAAPLPGPPRPDGRLTWLQSEPEPGTAHTFHFHEMSTRVFLLSRRRFHEQIGALRPRRPTAWKNVLLAALDGNPPQELPERLFSAEMRRRGLVRRDFLGRDPGMWSLHPPYRCAEFYRLLPELVRRVESGDVPDGQRGDHDLNDTMVDWSEARLNLVRNRWWRRLLRRSRPADARGPAGTKERVNNP